MIINMSGGRIDNLKFRVYAATSLPASGKENDVCIITSTPIPSWEVGRVDNPSWSMTAGFVYLTCAASDASQPNLLRKNALYLELTRCLQYENGTWLSKDAYQYRNGTWVQFSTTFNATIHITYPSGSTCKATDGKTTLTAPNTSGTWVCKVPNVGTWIVEASGEGIVTITETVTITGTSQIETVDITKRWLFKDGNQYTELTGGWSDNGYNYASYPKTAPIIGSDIRLQLSKSGAGCCIAGTQKTVDLTPYTKIWIYSESTSLGGFSLSVTGSGRNTHASSTIAVKDMGSVTNASQMFLDISSINKSVYIALSTWLNNGGSRDITVLKCWLE